MNEIALHMLVHAAARCREHVVKRGRELVRAAATDGHGLDDRNADLLPRAGERVEQSALAGIGAAGDGNERERVHLACGTTRTAPACLRRIATVMRPTRIAIGSRPNGPRWSGSTATPSSKPKCFSRHASPWSSASQSMDATSAFVPSFSWSRPTVSG